jgi:hypothetical protein
MIDARTVARSPHILGWDNTQISTSVHVEQRGLTPPKVQTGTTSMIYPIRNADVALRPILENRTRCNVITFKGDIRPTISQTEDLSYHLLLDVILILIDNCPGFEYLKGLNDLQHKKYRPPPPKMKTEEYVLRTTTIDEGSTIGNVKVTRNIYIEQLKFSPQDLDNFAIPCINDQATNARIRSAQFLRAGDVTVIDRMSNFQLGIGFFHCQMNLLWALLQIHRGAVDDIGSLQYYISLLQKVRLGQVHPDYHTLRSFVQQVLFGNIHLYWELESGLDLKAFAASKPTPDILKLIAQRIVDRFISVQALDSASGIPGDTEDTALRNTILLNRDLLLFYELCLSVSSGDFRRVEILLGTLTIMFAGAGCKNYTTEFLHFIQNIKKVWNPAFASVSLLLLFVDEYLTVCRNVMRDNLLINMSGRDGHFIGVDKNAETNINFQKV